MLRIFSLLCKILIEHTFCCFAFSTRDAISVQNYFLLLRNQSLSSSHQSLSAHLASGIPQASAPIQKILFAAPFAKALLTFPVCAPDGYKHICPPAGPLQVPPQNFLPLLPHMPFIIVFVNTHLFHLRSVFSQKIRKDSFFDTLLNCPLYCDFQICLSGVLSDSRGVDCIIIQSPARL